MRALTVCLLLLLLLPSSAVAYTLVMRGGRRVEIADGFRVHRAQLTYEAAPGVSVTLPLELVDVAETERANNEPAGSFLRRAAANEQAQGRRQADAEAGATATRQPARTLTNRELEPVRRARIESERAYERRRVELGLPSAEAARRRDREEEQALSARARQKAEKDADAESYWRERAAALREEAGALDAEISYLRDLLADDADNSAAGFSSSSGLAAAALTITAGSRPFAGHGGFARGFPDAPFFARNPANALLQNSGRRRFGGTRFVVNVNGGTRAGFGRFGRGARGKLAPRFKGGRFAHRRSRFFAPGIVGLVVPYDYAAADASALATRLSLLEGERAGIAARWRQLEEEARRAGAQPGWLRP